MDINVTITLEEKTRKSLELIAYLFTGRAANLIATNIIKTAVDNVGKIESEASPVKEEPADEKEEIQQAVTEQASDFPAPEQKKPKRTGTRKAKVEPVAPVAEEPAADDDLPFRVDEPPTRQEMSIDEFRVKLNDIRDGLQLNDGQENFSLKKNFTKLAREIMPFYGGDKSDMLTPANLYWYAEQLSRVELNGTDFVVPEPAITAEQVEQFKQTPF